ncbi:transketolase [Treponema primitia ZAS-2]|uniref:Transketolase n=1 Tax=Treponema primitia (strain ATCC BAA-887 / DSM 12427 / ZAS-2) TaxID=545694 RepID=F5YN46_TREPZ|nr:transketolase [Treponema primitia]AEF85178.1 transketolase [Treponema primitia ZAS-2]
MKNDLDKIAINLRRKIIKLCWLGKGGHITSSLSALDILITLYFGDILQFNNQDPEMEERDRFILSKGHAALALYNVLCEAGFFQWNSLMTFCKPGTIFGAEPTPKIPGIEGATGSLGHGLSFGVGIALSAKLKKASHLTYVLTGDGECQEGCIWEAAMSITNFKLNNLIWIIDYNGRQVNGRISEVMNIDPLDKKLEAFGFDVVSANGHNYNDLISVLKVDKFNLPIKPRAIILHTIKGKGIPLCEDKENWHGRVPIEEELNIIIEQLGITKKDFEEL